MARWTSLPICVFLLACVATPAAVGGVLDPALFPVPDNLRPNVSFWSDIYSRYTSDEAVLHDEWHLDIVYEVVDLADLESVASNDGQLQRLRRDRIDEVRDRIIADLRALARADVSTPERRRIEELWSPLEGGDAKYTEAARHVRMQIGLKNRFSDAIVRSGRYLPRIERLLAEEGVPSEISRLPFVESMFVSEARSRANAAGAWQFMVGTARHYLQMSSAVDSRIDPILAGAGAATMLRQDYEALGSWPLALTAYNHGRAGVARAARTVGSTDLGDIVEGYRSRRFGFASRNFYSEFIAAVQVYEDRQRLFPGVEPAPELRFDEFALPRFVSLIDLSAAADASLEDLRELNPALDEDVFRGTLLVPRSYPLRVPPGSRTSFENAYAGIPDERKRISQLQVGYRVQAGDTLGRIAARFGTSVAELQRANRLSRPDRIYVNQYLRIPGSPLDAAVRLSSTSSASTRSASTFQDTARHVVRRGENLTLIARRYGVSLESLRQHNRLISSVIHPGQELVIP